MVPGRHWVVWEDSELAAHEYIASTALVCVAGGEAEMAMTVESLHIVIPVMYYVLPTR